MKKYLAVYIGSLSPEKKRKMDISEELQMKGMQAWGYWIEKHSDSIVDIGGPLGKTKRVSPDGVEGHANKLTGYVIVEADSHEAAAEMFINHPHFSIFPGDSVEIVECLEIPGN